MKKIFVLGLMLAMAGCAANRNGYVESGPIKAGPNRYPVRILGVDGKMMFAGATGDRASKWDKYQSTKESRPGPNSNHFGEGAGSVGGVELEPGTHDLLISAGPFGTSPAHEVAIAFNVEPCTHYYFIADTDGLVPPAWKLVVEHEEPIADCAPISSERR